MTLATEVKKITRSKPFYALTGAGDLALEKARSYALTVQGKAETVARDMPEKARKYADSAAQRLTRLYDELAARGQRVVGRVSRSEEHTSELQSRENLVCRLLLEKKKTLLFQHITPLPPHPRHINLSVL